MMFKKERRHSLFKTRESSKLVHSEIVFSSPTDPRSKQKWRCDHQFITALSKVITGWI